MLLGTHGKHREIKFETNSESLNLNIYKYKL